MAADFSVPFAQNQPIRRRDALKCGLATVGAAALAAGQAGAAETIRPKHDDRRCAPKRYDIKKSINLWAFPYPNRMTLRECLQLASLYIKIGGHTSNAIRHDQILSIHQKVPLQTGTSE